MNGCYRDQYPECCPTHFRAHLDRAHLAEVDDMTYPTDPNGDMAPILTASVEAAMARHPSGRIGTDMHEAIEVAAQGGPVILNALDQCDQCGAAAVYRVSQTADIMLDFCLHHWRKNFPAMADKGWVVIGGNPGLLAEMSAT